MRKATKSLLLVAVAAFGLGACSDDVTVVEPQPPEPPPPEDAELTIQSVEDFQGDNVDPDNVSGKIVVVYNVESGDQDVSEVQLVIDGETQTCQTLSGNVSASVAGSGQSQQAAPVECILNTAAGAAQCTGDPLEPAFDNGEHTIGGQLVLADGTTIQATNTVTLNFNNDNTVLVEQMGGQGVANLATGDVYWGGEDITFAACPIVYDAGVEVGSVTLTVMDVDLASPQLLDLVPGTGTATSVTVSAAPFTATAAAEADNDGVEDPAGDVGQRVTVTSLRADDGARIDFTPQPVENQFDFTGPMVAAGAEVQIDNATITQDLYSSGAFSVSNVTDGGVGFDAGATLVTITDAGAPADTVTEDAEAVADLSEDDELVDGDANGVDAYAAEVSEVFDRLGNPRTVDVDAGTAGNQPATSANPFGVDMTAPTISNEEPTTDGIILNDTGLGFEAVDPDLASGDPGAGVDRTGCPVDATVDNCTNITAATDETTPTVLNVNDLGDNDGSTFEVALGALADGAYVVTADVPDLAINPANVANPTFDFVLDRTAPTVNIVDPPPGNVTSSNASLTFVIEGNASDANDLSALTVSVTLVGADDVCGTADDVALTEGSGPGEVDDQSRSIDVSAGGTISFTENFQIFNTGDGSDQDVCFLTTGEDNALDRTESANPNVNTQIVRTDIDWQ